MSPLATLLLLLAAQPVTQRVALPQAKHASRAAHFTVVGRATFAGKPLVEVGLAVELRLADEVLSSVDLVTDDDGGFTASLRPPGAEHYADDPWLRRKLRVRVRADEPGYMKLVWDEPIPTGTNVVSLRDLRWNGGGTLVLHLVDTSGAPVPSSEIEVERFTAPPTAPPPEGGERTLRCSALGPRTRWDVQPVVARPHATALDVHFERGEHAYILLRSSGRGTAYVPGLTMPTGYGDDERSVTLHGSGTLTGELRDPDGHPLPNVALTVFPSELIESASPEHSLREIRAERETAGGLVSDTCTTDAAGRFEVGGLRPGTYFMTKAGGDKTVGTIPREVLSTGCVGTILRMREVVDDR